MAITFDAVSSSGYKFFASYSFNHTVTGPQPILFVQVCLKTAVGPVVNSVTYNGISLTKIGALQTGLVRGEFWYLVAPPTGTHSVAVTLSTDPTTNSHTGAMSLLGVAQSSPLEGAGVTFGNNVPVSFDITSTTDNAWLVEGVTIGNVASNVTGPQTLRLREYNETMLGFATTPKSPPGTSTSTWSSSGFDAWVVGYASVKPYVALSSSNIHNKGILKGGQMSKGGIYIGGGM